VGEQRARLEAGDDDVHKVLHELLGEVGSNAWLGTGVTVGAGVRIGADSVIGAGSVVLSDVPDRVVAAGTPARVIREVG